MLKLGVAGALFGLFHQCDAIIYFQEDFKEGWEKRWVYSNWKAEEGSMGKFTLGTGEWFADPEEDIGLMTTEDHKHYTIAAAFPSFSNEDKPLIIQYQVKYEQEIECGGGYIKVGPTLKDLTTFGNETKYNIMFGPDKCGYNSRTQLIFNYKGQNIMKKHDLPHRNDVPHHTALYTLIIKPNNNVTVQVDQEKIGEFSLAEDWETLPPMFLVDKEDTKPEDWDDEQFMEDPEDEKPEDWIDEARIPMTGKRARKPADWDDEDDGVWVPPMMDNPEFKGEWSPRQIENPDYSGEWEARMLPNPDYYHDDQIYKYDDWGFIGIDVWQVKAGAIFDNIIITDSKIEAEHFAQLWKTLNKKELKMQRKVDDAKAAEILRDAKKTVDEIQAEIGYHSPEDLDDYEEHEDTEVHDEEGELEDEDDL